MSQQTYLSEINTKMDKVVESLKREMASIRTGRASPSLVEDIHVNYYETSTPIKQLGTISTPDPKMIVIEPWDKQVLSEIEREISQSDLGVTPMNDGKVIRVTLPALTSERREELAKRAKKITEDHKVSLRTIRRDANEEFKKLQKDGKITEDFCHDYQEDVQSKVEVHTKSLEDIFHEKETEIKEG